MQFGKAQTTTVIHDSAIRAYIQKEFALELQWYNWCGTLPALTAADSICFKGDTLQVSTLKKVSNSYFYCNGGVHNLSISLPNRNIKSMEGLQYFALPYLNVDLSSNLIDSTGFRKLNYDTLCSIYPYNQTNESTLNLSNNLLSGNAKQYIDGSINHIYLDSNYLTSFDSISHYSYGNYLYTLSLSHNQITTDFDIKSSDTSAINGTYTYGFLRLIDVSYNMISNAHFGFFVAASNYNQNKINMSHNLLTHIPIMTPREWDGGPNYGNLDLSYNNINSIDTNAIQVNPLSFFATSPGLNNTFIDTLNLSHNNITNPSSTALWDFTKQGKWLVSNVDLSYNNMNVSPDLFTFFSSNAGGDVGVLNYNCSHNNIYCLPKLPSILQQLVIDTNKITCLPNVGSFTINGHSSATYPVCNATNNMNGCRSFPTFAGNIYFDKNNNGTKDAGEPAMQNIKIDLLKGESGYTDSSGHFSITADSLGYQKISINAPHFYNAFPDTISRTFYTFYDSTVNVGNIPIRLTSIVDSLSIATFQYAFARPGGKYPIAIYYKNVGSTTLSPTVTLTYNTAKLIYDSCNNTSAVHSGSSISFNVNNLQANQYGYAIVYFRIKPSVSIGDSIKINSTITGGSASAQDNFSIAVRGSFDPNEKDATPMLTTTELAGGNYIDYTIHFQNTGNDTAFNIVVADTLSSKLQANSLQVVTSSHNCKTTLKDNKVYFEFRDILLPDSNVNLLGSNGFVRFRVKPINSLVVGDSINNKSSIYFDYNKPVLTNTATTKIVVPVIVPLKFTNYELRFTNERQVENHWITADEVNVSHFNVQRSLNGNDFVTIHKEQAKNRSYNEYSFIDNNPLSTVDSRTSKYYYRIVSVDKDGRTNYSEVRTINLQHQTSNITIFPNPAKDAVTINSKGVKHLTITDCFGRIVYKAEVNRASYILNLKSFAKGIYIFSFDNGEKVKVVKE